MNPGYVWPSARAAEEALLQYAGNPACESVVVRDVTLGELSDGLIALAPAVIELRDTGQCLAVTAPGKVLALNGAISRAKWHDVRKLWEDPAREQERLVFARLPIRAQAAEKVITRRIASRAVANVTHFATPPGASFPQQLASIGWVRRLCAAAAAHAFTYAIGLGAWVLIARAALSGRWDTGWFWGWVILLAMALPLEALTAWWQGWLSVALGGLLKQRLLAGSLEMDPDKIRHQGVGQLMGRVLESESLESLSLTGGAATILGTVEVVGATLVLSLGAMPMLCAGFFVLWIGITGIVAWRAALRRRTWMLQRNRLTHDLVEKMNGQRTRIAQQPPDLWHGEEDRSLAAYVASSQSLDRLNAVLTSLLPRGWLTLGVAALGYAFVTHAASETALAISTGGVLLGYQTLRRLVGGLGQLAGAAYAWTMVRDFFDAATEAEANHTHAAGAVSPSDKVLEVRGLAYSYPGRDKQALRNCSLTVHEGDRILLQGSSGSGKSTFGALLAGLRRHSGGVLLSGGIDQATIGRQQWRRRVATAPQYHENHVLAAPLLFNLLMGRAWPVAPQDIQQAAEICRELGLAGLIERMPAGLMEMVGDTGWQLSQGEKSRLFLARALLQEAPLVILDESFGALDPETLEQCLQCVLRRARSLMVIAHP